MSETVGSKFGRTTPEARLLELAQRGKSQVLYGIFISAVLAAVKIIAGIDGEVSVSRGHKIGHDVKNALLAEDLRIFDVAVHIEPVGLELSDPGRDHCAGPISD
ncbi:MAG: hypothetical protein ACWGQW_17480 [bacterium]